MGDAHHFELVLQRDDLHIVTCDGHNCLVVRLPKEDNIGFALAIANQYLRELAS